MRGELIIFLLILFKKDIKLYSIVVFQIILDENTIDIINESIRINFIKEI